MLKKIVLVSTIAGTVLLTGCANGLSPVGVGLITDVKGPLVATDKTGSKTGSACATSVLGLYNKGDASIIAAKTQGNIKSIASVDYHSEGFYPFYGKTCTIVTGE